MLVPAGTATYWDPIWAQVRPLRVLPPRVQPAPSIHRAREAVRVLLVITVVAGQPAEQVMAWALEPARVMVLPSMTVAKAGLELAAPRKVMPRALTQLAPQVAVTVLVRKTLPSALPVLEREMSDRTRLSREMLSWMTLRLPV